MIEYVGIGLLFALALGDGYFQGPGWLPHSECPHCCWCDSRVPLGDRVEERIASAVRGGRER